jgi:hypothetical protein
MEERIEVLESDLAYLYKKDIENRETITKILENNDKIIKTLVFRNQEIDKKLSLIFNFLDYLCNKNIDSEMQDFLIKNAIDIYNCDRKLFCKMIAKHEDMTMRCVNVFKLLFFDISYEELDDILEESSKYNKSGVAYSKWSKLHFLCNLVLQGYSLHKNESFNYKIFLEKMYKIFNETDVSSCPSPYNYSKEQFLKNTIFKLCYNEAKNML